MDKKDISVVIQGIYDPGRTERAVESARRFLDGAQIIYSTWKGTEEKYSPNVDKLLFLNDPGIVEGGGSLRNINRQVLGRKRGLSSASRKYTLLMRADSEIINLNFIAEFEKKYHKGKYPEYNFLDERIVACSAGKKISKLYFLCDWFFFGRTDDLRALYDIPLVPGALEDDGLPEHRTPHEYLAINFVRKYLNCDYTYRDRKSTREVNQWTKILVENFIMLGFSARYGILNLKEPYCSNQLRNDKEFLHQMMHLMKNYEYEDWVRDYDSLYNCKTEIRHRLSWRLANLAITLYRRVKPLPQDL